MAVAVLADRNRHVGLEVYPLQLEHCEQALEELEAVHDQVLEFNS